jgi:phosphoribosyl-ATP pyrophosphohydrolase/phosphoribosyl-AMP cyclohydrolase
LSQGTEALTRIRLNYTYLEYLHYFDTVIMHFAQSRGASQVNVFQLRRQDMPQGYVGAECAVYSRRSRMKTHLGGIKRTSKIRHDHPLVLRAVPDQQEQSVVPESDIDNMSAFLDSLKWDSKGLAVAIAQHIDTGEVLMQAFVDRAAVNETLQTGYATFYSRSRNGRWCKGETSGHYINVKDVYLDCDKDSIIYLSEPIGPACHTNAATCYFSKVSLGENGVSVSGSHESRVDAPMTTLYALERTIEQRRLEGLKQEKPSWTVKLLNNPELLCKKVREEAGELCQTWEEDEGKERAASEAADLFYHAMVLLNVQGVTLEDVSAELRKRFGTSGIEEKASRGTKTAA